jgi:predicted metal-dependent phosphoesterase TrpH
MQVDLHVHSTASDGTEQPADLVASAVRARLGAIALTDHDTLEGLDAAGTAADALGIRLIPGVELSCDWEGGAMHLVVLFLQPGSGPLQDRLAVLRKARDVRNARIVERLVGMGIEITIDEVLDEAGGGTVGRPHLAAVLVRKEVVPDIPTAFDRYLAAGRPAYVGRERLTPVEAISLARVSGGVPVLAHPLTLGITLDGELRATLRQLAEMGLIGVEVEYSTYLPEERLQLRRLAAAAGLLPSGGTDYHGAYKPDILLGVGKGDLAVAESILDDLEAARPTMLPAR